jgi:hypothetical protein
MEVQANRVFIYQQACDVQNENQLSDTLQAGKHSICSPGKSEQKEPESHLKYLENAIRQRAQEKGSSLKNMAL